MAINLKEMRKKAGMTQKELAGLSGVSRATICALERGEARNTTTTVLTRLAQALGVLVDDLFPKNA